MLRTSKYIFILFSFLLVFSSHNLLAQSTTDTTSSEDTVKKPKINYGHQVAVSFDVAQILYNNMLSYRKGYELAAEYYMKDELYLVAEGGWGSSNIYYTDLAYTTTNNFFRLGINRSLLERASLKDWDMMFIGLRFGMAFIDRSAGSYNISDTLWGNSSGTIPAKNLTAYWAEVTGGMRLELVKGFYIGYNIRGRFLMDVKALKDLAPQFIAGYGRGDKSSVFDFNLYLTYGIRWNKHSSTLTPKQVDKAEKN